MENSAAYNNQQQTKGQFNSRIDEQVQFQNCLFKKMELELINLELKFADWSDRCR